MSKDNPRLLAVKTLNKISNGSYSNLQLNQVIEHSDLDSRDISLLTNIVYGVIQHRLTLEYYLNSFLKNPKKIDSWVRELLYTSIYQMYYLNKIPERAIFNESIKIAKKLGHDGIRRMVTGTLHQIQRNGLPSFNEIEDPMRKLSIEYSVSPWIIEELNQQVGNQKTISILESINKPSKQSVRFNSKLIDKSVLSNELQSEGYEVKNSSLAKSGLILTDKSASYSDLFKTGKMTIQDESAMLPVESMDIKPHYQILDACSAPGGKTTQIAEKLDYNQGGHVFALDLHEKRLKQVEKNAKRLGVSDVLSTEACDARKIDSLYKDGQFDQILIDAPCSGIGLIRRKPEIRYEKQLSDVNHLSNIQLDILNSVAPKLKSGGKLVYSTCTILNQENSDVIDKFLSLNSDFELVTTKTLLDLKNNDKYLKIYPDDYESDGFFVCNLIKK
ncbi:16S rRNA (cytosine(967)-C(5))-methyltransferase RsmB [Apilactobacillus micheneri]|uniref:16S rRNA (cytosine(967)-C(5))-methyltransferase n=1 Tax=Apilactobacillus micheneri TaxID=1899430 RepID=A0A9Q8IMB3_9LACO|nr:16S rRNA (cytosine(967)-C(5))-methyltransferase RsmB [Apilactobacillus micheneri]TPR40578.1 16S rRNA (cytosine(967)-C(5))-methyltransferase RsmB [Apilactobacillus micheneri]TPR42045.1 16S rRNA (cytosine(967)-C(5))-methyltransferase RsmB [Apilactobacillus micheneri]TPR44700.1 16S rRNA (cytosine(967)-C(5))-methyltransferase RsmB [Apilactobacillus micheneri]TPR44999.1 16S rRNA (cytosine(967)-C(5))-methyltransferase RsmB [Apilactobacillus micheneri]TPR46341.1 16S rRNA (cytosine(967)-C(5))-methy